jgi:hypothetical protein
VAAPTTTAHSNPYLTPTPRSGAPAAANTGAAGVACGEHTEADFLWRDSALMFVAPDDKVEELGQKFCRNVVFVSFVRPAMQIAGR